VRRAWADDRHDESQGRVDHHGDGGVTRRPRPSVRRDEPEILRWTGTLNEVLGQRHAASFPCPRDDAEKYGDKRRTKIVEREAAKAMNLQLFASCSPANAVTAVCAPEGMDSGVIVKEMRSRFGTIVSNGQGSMKGKIFRLAHLGYYDACDLFAALAALEITLLKVGYKVELGSGVRAAQEVYLRHF